MLKTPWKTSYRHPFQALVDDEIISQQTFDDAKAGAQNTSVDLETVLMAQHGVTKDSLLHCLGEHFLCRTIEYTDHCLIDSDLRSHLNLNYLNMHHWVPLSRDGRFVDVLIDNPHDWDKCSDIERAFQGLEVRHVVALGSDIKRFFSRIFGRSDLFSISAMLEKFHDDRNRDFSESAGLDGVPEHDGAIVQLAHHLISEAHRAGSSDIHIEPSANHRDTMVRFRIDGSCVPFMKIPSACRRAIVSRFKIMAGLDIAERRKPQDGKIRCRTAEDEEIELRVATIPTAGVNEDVVIRILTAKKPLPLESMDLAPSVRSDLARLAKKPYGIILCVGPTGSGKTTTLHALLKYMNTQDRKIWTVEDPIEITQEGLRQVQVHPKIGLTFATAMRAFLRADPDVIMIGEMRDKETADIALEASLTGHLVLSTLHTNSAVDTITRLLDLGCDSFNFADAVLGILAKRLCKRLCPTCRESYHATPSEYEALVAGYGAPYWPRVGRSFGREFLLSRGRGCNACNRTGFKGRIALHELLIGSEAMREKIQAKAPTSELLHLSLESGMTTLVQDGIHKVLQGLTTFDQVQNVAMK